jgi:nucleoside-diphosphate-sugar epimerase
MKIFLTGATGFIGSHFLRRCLRDGHDVTALRRPTSLPVQTVGRQPAWCECSLDKLDVGDLAGFDALVHLAAVGVSPKQASWDELFYWNVSTQLRLLAKAASAGVRRVAISGSFIEYGRSADRYDFIPPDAALLPTSPYAASKAAGFIAASTFALEQSLAFSYLRIFSAFGDGQYEKNFWPALKAAALSGADFPMTAGEQVRDYIAVENVAAEILKEVERLPAEPVQRVRNIGSGKPVTMRTFAEHWWSVWRATGTLRVGALDYRPNEPMRFVPLLDS